MFTNGLRYIAATAKESILSCYQLAFVLFVLKLIATFPMFWHSSLVYSWKYNIMEQVVVFNHMQRPLHKSTMDAYCWNICWFAGPPWLCAFHQHQSPRQTWNCRDSPLGNNAQPPGLNEPFKIRLYLISGKYKRPIN